MIPALAQTNTTGDLYDHVESIIGALPGPDDDDYGDPEPAQVASWQSALTEIFEGNYAAADSLLQLVDYHLTLFLDTDTDQTFLVLEKTPTGVNYWGTYVFNPAACRPELIIMSPHPKKDLNTGKQGIYCYLQCDALAFMLAGTNRCNALDESPCSGTTSVCGGGSSPYRSSDLAHSTTSIWQSTVLWLRDALPSTWFVQLHGFAMQEDDPYVIMSNGTRENPYPDKIAALRDHLDIVDPVLTFRIGHEDLEWSRLLGFTNTNGRLINASSDPCEESADQTSGRFLHIEQEKTRLRQDVFGWNKMARALAATFRGGGCPAVAPIDDHDTWYVLEGQNGDGRSWEAANGYLRGVLHLADAGDTVCIGAGTYAISLYHDPLESIELHDPLTIMGGFPAGGGNYSTRDWVTYQTIITGDPGTPANTEDNCHTLINDINMQDTVTIDGIYLHDAASSSSAAMTFDGSGCVILRNVAMSGLLNPQVVFNAQSLILDNVSIEGTSSIPQTPIVNLGVLVLKDVSIH